jgi:hypothetical protein
MVPESVGTYLFNTGITNLPKIIDLINTVFKHSDTQ